MKNSIKTARNICTTIVLTLVSLSFAFTQTSDDLAQDIYERVEITGRSFKIAIGYPIIPIETGDVQNGIPSWVWVGTGIGGGIITYVLLTGDDPSNANLIANDDIISIPCNGSGNLNVLNNDQGTGLEVTQIQSSSSADIIHTGNGNVSISNVGSASFSFMYTISDDQNQSSTATVAVNVVASDLIISDDDYTFDLGMTISDNVLSNDVGSNMSVIQHSSSSNGSLSIATDGALQYTPNQDFCGQENITYLVRDECGQEASGQIQISGVDTENPNVTCPSGITISCSEILDPSITGIATAEDNCSSVDDITLLFVDDISSLVDCNGTGLITRTWIATDAAGLSSSCVQEIQIQDTTPPSITCPSDISVECGASIEPSETGQAEAADQCGLESLTYEDDLTSLNGCNNTGTFARMWTAIDSCGNTVQCQQSITIMEDITAPEISCPADISVLCSASTDPSNTGMATAIEHCGVSNEVEIIYEDGNPTSGCNPHFTRTWTATDSCGNSISCEQIITLMDEAVPTISCPQDTVISCTTMPIPDVTGFPIITDDCGVNGVDVTYVDEFTPNGPCAGMIIRTWTAIDSCGNTVTCDQQIELKEVNCDFTYSTSTTNASCGINNGTAFLFVTPGNTAMGPFTYEWSDGQTGNQAVGLYGGLYQATITDVDLGCSITVDVQIVEDPPDYIDNVEVQPASCTSVGNIFIDLLSPGSGPMIIDIFLPDGGFISIPGIPDNSTFVLTDWVPDPPTGEYTFIITDQSIGPQCQQVISIDLPQAAPLTIFLEAVIPPSGPTANDGEIFIGVEPVGAFPPFEVFVNNQFIGTVSALNFVINNVPAGFYTIYVINSQGCVSNVLEVQVNAGISLKAMSSTSQPLLDLPKMIFLDTPGSNGSMEHPISENEIQAEWVHVYQSPIMSLQYPFLKKTSLHMDLGYSTGTWENENIALPIEGRATQVMFAPSIRWTLTDTKWGLYFIEGGYQFRKTSIATSPQLTIPLTIENENIGSVFLRTGAEYTLGAHDKAQLQMECRQIDHGWQPSLVFRLITDIVKYRKEIAPSLRWID